LPSTTRSTRFRWPSRSRSRPSCTGDTLSALLDDLDAAHPGLKGRLITDDGGLHRFVNVYVNDEDVRFTGSLDTVLKDGDSVTILPAVAGG
jgi:sulfur-carrier protein